MVIDNQYKEDFIKARKYFEKYFNGEELPDYCTSIDELQKKWALEERRQKVKAKLYLRQKKQFDKKKEAEVSLSKILNLRKVDCCRNCGRYSDYDGCEIFKIISTKKDDVCDKYKLKEESPS